MSRDRIEGDGAFTEALKMARYGHKYWIVWRKAGVSIAAKRSPASIREAMLATGTQGKFTMITASDATPMVINWRIGVNLLAWERRGYV